MNAWLQWTLPAAALALGGWLYGWRGLVLALTMIVFWLLLQWSRALRTLRGAATRPIGSVASAVMLHARLKRGMPMAEVLKLTQSLGRAVGSESYLWQDGGGDAVRADFRAGRLADWRLERAAPAA